MDERISYTLRFCRFKRNLSQEELAKLANVSQSSITAIESMRQKMGIGTISRIIQSLGIDLKFLKDSGLYSIYPDCHRFQTAKIVCAILDVYCYSIPDDLSKRLGFSDSEIKSLQMKKILEKLKQKEQEEIFKFPLPPHIAIPEKERTTVIIRGYVEEDPFFTLLRLLKVDFIDYFRILFSIQEKFNLLKTLSLKELHALSSEILFLKKHIEKLIVGDKVKI